VNEDNIFRLGDGLRIGRGRNERTHYGRDGRADESTTIHWTLPSQLCRLVAIRGNLNGRTAYAAPHHLSVAMSALPPKADIDHFIDASVNAAAELRCSGLAHWN
jgi:hypothetical protein